MLNWLRDLIKTIRTPHVGSLSGEHCPARRMNQFVFDNDGRALWTHSWLRDFNREDLLQCWYCKKVAYNPQYEEDDEW